MRRQPDLPHTRLVRSLSNWLLLLVLLPVGALAQPSAVAVNPGYSSGPTQILGFQYSDSDGYTHIQVADMLINSTLSGVGACYTMYYPSANTLYLANDGMTGWIGPAMLGSSSTLTNGQCSINVSTATASGVGTTLTLTLPITIKSSVAGQQTIYGWAMDDVGRASGTSWTLLGYWLPVPLTTAPSVISVSPNYGSGGSQVFSFQYSDPNGYSYIQVADVLINSSLSGAGACYTMYYPSTNTLYLANDDLTGWTGPLTPGVNGVLSNSQCSIDGSNSAALGVGTTLTLNLAVTFQPSFSGTRAIFGWVRDVAGASSGAWTNLGSWVLQAPNAPPSVLSITPFYNFGPSQTVSIEYWDTWGYTHFQTVDVLINSSLSGLGACYAMYLPGNNTLSLANDALTGWLGPITLGTSGSVQNSQCMIDASHSSALGSGSILTLNLAITLKAGVTGQQIIYGWAMDNIGIASGTSWTLLGYWLPVPLSTPPAVVSVSPGFGTGTSQVFKFQYSDVNGYAYLQAVDVLINFSATGPYGCYVIYYGASKSLYLANDNMTAWLGPGTPGASGTLVNDQCSIDMGSASVSGLGTTLTLNLPITFQPGFAGMKTVYGWALDYGGHSSGPWTVLGGWAP